MRGLFVFGLSPGTQGMAARHPFLLRDFFYLALFLASQETVIFRRALQRLPATHGDALLRVFGHRAGMRIIWVITSGRPFI